MSNLLQILDLYRTLVTDLYQVLVMPDGIVVQ